MRVGDTSPKHSTNFRFMLPHTPYHLPMSDYARVYYFQLSSPIYIRIRIYSMLMGVHGYRSAEWNRRETLSKPDWEQISSITPGESVKQSGQIKMVRFSRKIDSLFFTPTYFSIKFSFFSLQLSLTKKSVSKLKIHSWWLKSEKKTDFFL